MGLNIYNRTFGFEFEVADVEKSRVTLPSGYSWSKEETIVNSDGRIVKSSFPRGGELNTPPLLLRQSFRKEVRDVLAQIFGAGGRCTWCHGFAVHIYAGDLELEELKRVFLLSYYTSNFIREIADVGEWSEYPNQAPVPTAEYAENARDARSLDDLKNVFANSSVKGFIRHLINISAYFKHGTIEFRIFNSTYDLDEIEASVLFAFKFVRYAVGHTEEDFAAIRSMDDFRNALRFHGTLARKQKPLLFSGDQNNEEMRYVSKPINIARGHLRLLAEGCGDELATVNPNIYTVEASLYGKVRLHIFNTDEFNDVIYRCATGKLRIEYKEAFSFLQNENGDSPELQVCCLLLFHRMHRYTANNEFAAKMLDSIKAAVGESIGKAAPVAEKIVKMLNDCEYTNGTLADAIDSGAASVFYQYENNPRTRSTMVALKRYSDYADEYERKAMDYYGAVEKVKPGQSLMLVSCNEFLGLPKVGKIGRQIFYVTEKQEEKGRVSITEKPEEFFSFEFPPDDLAITDSSKLHIEAIRPLGLTQLQKTFVKRVTKFKRAFCAFAVMYDKYCLGAFGFDFSKTKEYDIWLLSDFCTNNAIPRLSKLVLLCTQTEKVRKLLQRSLGRGVKTVFSYVYTSHPVSMKYRGVYKNVDGDKGRKCLTYVSELGIVSGEDEVMERYKKMIQKK